MSEYFFFKFKIQKCHRFLLSSFVVLRPLKMKVVKLFFVGITVLIMQFETAYAGEDFFKNKSVGGYYHYGYVWAHKPRVEHLNTGHTQGGELFFQTQTDGSKWWHRVLSYPQIGFS